MTRSLPRRARYLGSLGPVEAALTLASIADLLAVDRRLRRAGYAAALAAAERPHPLRALVRRVPPAIVARAIHVAARVALPGDGPCLRRAILLSRLLRSAGTPCDLVAGVARVEGKWTGHAWVEVAGRPLHESPDLRDRYPLFRDQLSRLYPGDA